MEDLKEFCIRFAGLKDGNHEYNFVIDNDFFEFFDYEDFNYIDARVDLNLNKKPNMLELDFRARGVANLDCDVSCEPYEEEINKNLSLVIKFGEEEKIIDEGLYILPDGAYEMEVQQWVYESIVLDIPMKRVHPKVEDGTMDSKIMEKLDKLSPGEDQSGKNKGTDPRWNKLKELLNEN